MFKLISFLITGCWHDWKDLNQVIRVYWDSVSKYPMYHDHLFQCSKCSRFKRFRE